MRCENYQQANFPELGLIINVRWKRNVNIEIAQVSLLVDCFHTYFVHLSTSYFVTSFTPNFCSIIGDAIYTWFVHISPPFFVFFLLAKIISLTMVARLIGHVVR